jgi:hypothetical protein
MRARERDGLFDIVNIAIGRAAICIRSSPRGAPRDARVAGTPLRGPMIPAPAKAGDRPVFMGPGSPPAYAGVGRDDFL